MAAISGSRLTAVLIVALTTCVVAAAVVAFALGRADSIRAADPGSSVPTVSEPSTDPGTPDPPTSTATTQDQTTQDQTTQSQTTSRPSSTVPTTPAPSTTTPTTSAAPPTTGSTTGAQPTIPPSALTPVTLSDAASGHARAQEVEDLLQRHFTAINTLDYDLWTQTVTIDQVRSVPRSNWIESYRTTVDSDIVVREIADSPLRVYISFRSQQSADRAPDGRSQCLLWSLDEPLVEVDGSLRIALRTAGQTAPYRVCTA